MPRPVIASPHKKRRIGMIQSTPNSNISANGPPSERLVPQTKKIRCGEQSPRKLHFISQLDLHPVVGDARFYTALGSHCAKFCPERALVNCDNFRATMADDGSRHVLLRAPHQLRPDRCMPDERISPLANERPRKRGAIADVNLYAFQRSRAITDEHEIRRIKNARTACTHAVCDSWSQNRVFDWECLECDAADIRGRAFLD